MGVLHKYEGREGGLQPPGIFRDGIFEGLNPGATNKGEQWGLPTVGYWSGVPVSWSLVTLATVTTEIQRDGVNATTGLECLSLRFEVASISYPWHVSSSSLTLLGSCDTRSMKHFEDDSK